VIRGTVLFARDRKRYWIPCDEDGARSQLHSELVALVMANGGRSADFVTEDRAKIESWRPCRWTEEDEAAFALHNPWEIGTCP